VSDIQWWVYLAVLGGLLIVSLLLHVLVRVAAPPGTPAKKHGMMALFIGLDDAPRPPSSSRFSGPTRSSGH
jgi:hypothetical protein